MGANVWQHAFSWTAVKSDNAMRFIKGSKLAVSPEGWSHKAFQMVRPARWLSCVAMAAVQDNGLDCERRRVCSPSCSGRRSRKTALLHRWGEGHGCTESDQWTDKHQEAPMKQTCTRCVRTIWCPWARTSLKKINKSMAFVCFNILHVKSGSCPEILFMNTVWLIEKRLPECGSWDC